MLQLKYIKNKNHKFKKLGYQNYNLVLKLKHIAPLKLH